MLHLIFKTTAPLPGHDPIKDRIEAKKILWNATAEQLPEIYIARLTKKEIIDHLIQLHTEHLHESFTVPEIFIELQTAIRVFKIRTPSKLENIFSIHYTVFITRKIQVYAKQTRQQ